MAFIQQRVITFQTTSNKAIPLMKGLCKLSRLCK
jgi:hypothetical protein